MLQTHPLDDEVDGKKRCMEKRSEGFGWCFPVMVSQSKDGKRLSKGLPLHVLLMQIERKKIQSLSRGID